MPGVRGNYQDSTPYLWAEDINQDTATFLGNDAAILTNVYGGWNVRLAGGALTAGAGMVVNVAGVNVIANGVLLSNPGGSVTLGAGATNPRYDVIYVRLGTMPGANTISSQPTVADTSTLGVYAGTPAASPLRPALPDATYAQIGTVLVPANVTAAAQCTLNSGDVAPNAQSPASLVDLVLHLASQITSATSVHGITVTTPGGGEANRVTLSGATGRVGLATYADVAGTLTNPVGGTSAGINVDGGQVAGQVVPNGGSLSYPVSFNRSYANPPSVVPGIVTATAMALGLTVGVSNITRTGCTIQIGNTSGSSLLIGATWVAYGT